MSTVAYRQRRAALLGAAAAVSLVFLASCGKSSKSVDEYLSDAKTHRDAHNFNAALIDLKNAIGKDNKNLPARELLIRTYLDLGEAKAAADEVVQAATYGGKELDLAEPRAEADLVRGEYKKVIADTDSFPDDVPPQVQAQLNSLRATALGQLQRFDEARAALSDAQAEDPQSVDLRYAAARVAVAQGDTATAASEIEAGLKLSPADARLLALRGSIEYQSANPEFAASEKDLKSALEQRPWDLALRLSLARVQYAEDKQQEGDATLAIVLKAMPKDVNANYLRALSAYRKKDYSAALAALQFPLAATNGGPVVLLAASANFGAGLYDKAAQYATEYLKTDPKNTNMRKLLAEADAKLGRAGDAVKALSPTAGNAADDPELLTMIGTAAARGGDMAEADKYLSMAVSKVPDNPLLRTRLAMTEIFSGNSAGGIEDLEKAAAADPKAVAPEALLVVSLTRQQQYDKAIEAAQTMQKSRPQDPMGFDFEGTVQGIKGDKEQARAAYAKALAIKPGDPTALHDLGALAVSDNKLDEATGYYQKLLKANAADTSAAIDLAEVQVKSDHIPDAQATLQQAIAANRDDPRPRLVLGRLDMLLGNNADALAAVSPALQGPRQDPTLLDIAGRAQLALGNPTAARDLYKKMVDELPKAPGAHLSLARAYEAASDPVNALDETRKAAALDPKRATLQGVLVERLIAQRKYDEAAKLVQDLKGRFPKWGALDEYFGLIRLGQNQPELAIAPFQAAIQTQDNGLFRRHLAEAQELAGHFDDAVTTLRSWADAHGDDVAVRVQLADVELRGNRPDAALADAKKAVDSAPNSAAAKIALLRIMLAQHDDDDAAKLAAALQQANAKSADILEAVGLAYYDQGRAKEAIAPLDQAASLSANNGPYRIRLAMANADAGKPDAAVTMLKGWLGTHPDDQAAQSALGGIYLSTDHANDAVELYKSMLQRHPDSAVIENNYAWALAKSGDATQALAHARRAAALAPDEAGVQDTLGSVLLQSGATGDAVTALRRAATLDPTDPAIQFHLAKALASSGDKPGALAILQRLLANTSAGFKDRAEATSLLSQLRA